MRLFGWLFIVVGALLVPVALANGSSLAVAAWVGAPLALLGAAILMSGSPRTYAPRRMVPAPNHTLVSMANRVTPTEEPVDV